MTPLAWLVVLTLGGLLGVVGQGARAVIGLKKEAQEAAADGVTLAARFSGSQLGVSLLIGFVAGALGMIGLVAAGKVGDASVDGQTMVTLLGMVTPALILSKGLCRAHFRRRARSLAAQ